MIAAAGGHRLERRLAGSRESRRTFASVLTLFVNTRRKVNRAQLSLHQL
jgi:hypothetical protein